MNTGQSPPHFYYFLLCDFHFSDSWMCKSNILPFVTRSSLCLSKLQHQVEVLTSYRISCNEEFVKFKRQPDRDRQRMECLPLCSDKSNIVLKTRGSLLVVVSSAKRPSWTYWHEMRISSIHTRKSKVLKTSLGFARSNLSGIWRNFVEEDDKLLPVSKVVVKLLYCCTNTIIQVYLKDWYG